MVNLKVAMPPYAQQMAQAAHGKQVENKKKKTKIKQQHETFITNQVSADDAARVLHGTGCTGRAD